MKMQTIPLLAAIGVLLVIGGCDQAAETPAPEPEAEVTIALAALGDLPVLVDGYGVVDFDPAGQRTLTAEIEARVRELAALPGDVVKKGQVVLRLGPSESAAVEIARVRRDAIAAEAAAARARRLRTDGFASDGDVEAAEGAAADLAALAESLEGRAGDISSLRAPIEGVVDALFVEPGDLVTPGAQLLRLASPDSVQAKIRIEIEDASRLSEGAPVRLSGIDSGSLTLETSIRTIDYRVDPATRMATVFVAIPGEEGLLPGEAVRAEMTAEIRHRVVLVPREAVFVDETGPYVFVESAGRAALRRLETGITVRGKTEVSKGLSPGEKVVVEGAAVLSDGMAVRELGAAAQTRPAGDSQTGDRAPAQPEAETGAQSAP